MRVRFWGTRGSLPASVTARVIREKIRTALQKAQGEDLSSDAALDQFIDTKLPFSVSGAVGTNTSCLQIDNPGGDYLLIDCGSGLRDFAVEIMRGGAAHTPATYHIFITHLHWDHLQGFPFFIPAFIEGNRIIFHSQHPELEQMLHDQMRAPVFPVPFGALKASISFDIQPPGEAAYRVGDFEFRTIQQQHPGISYGYRVTQGDKVLVHSTDSEHNHDAYNQGYRFVDFFRDADLLVFDAQYTMAEATFTKANWGHSSNVMGVELAARAGVKTLALFHHEPTSSDRCLEDFLVNTRMYADIYHQEAGSILNHPLYPEQIILAYDGLVWDL